MLTYKTIGMSDPKGKPRVYFTCHPEDFAGTFETLSEDILRCADCAVWYNDAPEDEGTVVPEQDLTQMQLFVMPVTTRLLFTPNAALSRDFPFAIKNTIPVLPILMEDDPVIVEAFNTRCGHLQAISRARRNLTEIPYEEKLKRYLQALLISDEMAQKVRDAFDAYIFLSYRKKDRAKAQELMRLIHRDSSCESVAIWYDEFLRPSENFDQSIQRMLEDSDVFTLLVTHNLVKEDNYVLREEYPKAKELEKPVLAVNADKTPAEAVEGAFGEALACVGMEEEEKLHKELREKLREKLSRAARETEGTPPEHKYLMGLAYLGGIDVEVDHERAVRLIQSAAEAGLPEAMERLVTMYRKGEAVERDYQAAIQWQEKLVDVRRAEYQEEKSVEKLLILSSAFQNLGDYNQEVGKLPEAKKIFNELRTILEEQQTASQSVDIDLALAACYDGLGESEELLDRAEAAREYYLKAFELRKTILSKDEKSEIYWALSASNTHLGDIEEALGRTDSASQYFEQAVEFASILAHNDNSSNSLLRLASHHINLANNERKRWLFEDAQKNYCKSIEIIEAIVETKSSLHLRELLAECYIGLGKTEELDDDKLARDYFQKAIDILDSSGMSPTFDAYRVLSEACFYMARIGQDNSEKRKNCLRAIELFEKLVSATRLNVDCANLAACYSLLGDLEKDNGTTESAYHCYSKSLEMLTTLAEEASDIHTRRMRASAYRKLGSASIELSNYDEALKCLKECIHILETLATELDGVDKLDVQLKLHTVYGEIAEVNKHLGCFEQGEEYKKANEEVFETMITNLEKDPDDNIEELYEQAARYEELGRIEDGKQRPHSAKDYFLKANALLESLVRRTKSAKAQRKLAKNLEGLGLLEAYYGDLDNALVYYKKSLAIFESLAKKANAIEAKADLSSIYAQIGLTEGARNELKQAWKCCHKALKISKTLIRQTKQTEIIELHAKNYCMIGMVEAYLGRLRRARKNYLQSLRFRKMCLGESVTAKLAFAECLNKLGEVERKLGNEQAAQEYARKAAEIRARFS